MVWHQGQTLAVTSLQGLNIVDCVSMDYKVHIGHTYIQMVDGVIARFWKSLYFKIHTNLSNFNDSVF